MPFLDLAERLNPQKQKEPTLTLEELARYMALMQMYANMEKQTPDVPPNWMDYRSLKGGPTGLGYDMAPYRSYGLPGGFQYKNQQDPQEQWRVPTFPIPMSPMKGGRTVKG